MLGMPIHLSGSRKVQAKPKRRRALTHFACDVLAAAHFVSRALAVIGKMRPPTPLRASASKNLTALLGRLASRSPHLHSLQVDRFSANRLAHLDGIAIRGRKKQQTRPELVQQ